MKVLFVIHYPVYGGPHNEALRLAPWLKARGVDLVILLPDEEGDAAPRLRDAGLNVVTRPLHRLRVTTDPRIHLRYLGTMRRETRMIRRLIEREGIDVVQVGGLVNPHAAMAGRSAKVPVVWQVVDTRPPRFMRIGLMPLVMRLADAVMFNGKKLIELHGDPSRPGIAVIPYYPPVDTDKFVPSPELRRETRERFGIPQDAFVAGTVANLNPQKGIEYFVRAAISIHRARPDSWFLLVGPKYETHAEYAAMIEDEIDRSGVPKERFVFTGGVTDVESYYPAMDVQMITSIPNSEGTTTTSLEAMACGVPVIATNVAAVGELVEDGVTGILVPPEDPAALSEAVLKLRSDEALGDRLIEGGRRRVLERHSKDAAIRPYLEAYESAQKHHADRKRGRKAAR
jgi:glycosyltransferase involved in cell wall biosynthesis